MLRIQELTVVEKKFSKRDEDFKSGEGKPYQGIRFNLPYTFKKHIS